MSENSSTQTSSVQNELMSMMLKAAKQSMTLFDQVEEHKSIIEDSLKDSKPIKDAYGNSLSAIGNNDKVETFTNYGFSNDTLNWSLWLALYNDSWVFKRAIDKPAQDEIKCGITLQGSSDFNEVYKLLKKYRFSLIQLLQWGALFGGSVAVMMFSNLKDEDYKKRMDFKKIVQAKAMRMWVTDRWYGVAPHNEELVTNMNSVDFGKPKYYDITFADGRQITVHHSYVVRYEHRVAPMLVKNGMLQGWGYAEGAHILNELSRDDKLKASIQSLVDKSLIEVIKMSGMRGVFMGADADNEAQLRKRLEMVNWGRTFNSLTFLDKEDEYSQNSYGGLGGLSDLLEENMWLISAALEMQGILFGDLKTGFENDSMAMQRYNETILGRCESYVRPVYEKLLPVLYAMCKIDEKPEFEFNSLIKDVEDENRMKSIHTFCQLCSLLMNDGVIDLPQYGKALQKFTSKNIIDFSIDDKVIKELERRQQEESEDIEGLPI